MIPVKKHLALLLSALLLISVCGGAFAESSSAPASPAVADASQMTAVEDVVEEGMVPVSGEEILNGDYPVTVESSSSMFRIVEAVLHCADGAMTATITMSGTSYLYVYPGTALEAATSEQGEWVPYAEDSEGRFCFTIPVEALDAGVPCAAFSKNKELWYERTLLFRADSLPAEAFAEGFFTTAETLKLDDGEYLVDVSLSGGSGRAKLESPAVMRVEEGKCTATLVWGSRNYDYMKVGETKVLPLSERETSTFEIPVAFFDRPVTVIADTVAMSEPHEIEYRLLFSSDSLERRASETASGRETALRSAKQFQIEPREDGASVLTVGGKDRYLLLSREADIPADLEENIPVIRIPVGRVYVASSSVPDLFLRCGALDRIRFTSTNETSWKLPELQEAMRNESILYAGKYSAPDYELLLEEDCDLVIENTMILHKPEVKEKLEALGLPVMVEYSSYEPEPLGRVEWIRLYGLLTGRQEAADAFFEEQEQLLESSGTEPTGRTAAFFHLTSGGAAVVRRSSDYVTKMIELAGGTSPFTDLPQDDSALSTVTIQMESFYAQAKDADVLIYNSTVSGDVEKMEDLIEKSSLFSDFKAVQNGEVWCTEQSMFQQSSATAGMISDIRAILSGEAEGVDQLTWLHRVR